MQPGVQTTPKEILPETRPMLRNLTRSLLIGIPILFALLAAPYYLLALYLVIILGPLGLIALLIGLAIVLLPLGGIWFGLFKVYAHQKYLVCLILIILVSVLLGSALRYVYVTSEKQQKAEESSPDTPVFVMPHGFLVPTTQTAPPEFRDGINLYTNGSYNQTFYIEKNATSTWEHAYIVFREGSDSNVSYNNRKSAISSIASTSNFTYNNQPGITYSMPVRNNPALFSYGLLWNDAGKGLEITLYEFPKISSPDQYLINMLKTMQRS